MDFLRSFIAILCVACCLIKTVHSEDKNKRWFKLNGKHLKVTTILIEPYMMVDDKLCNTTGNGKFYGYMADLIAELSDYLEFSYDINIVPDGSYGYKQSNGQWDGMIGQLMKEEADIAAGPLYITEHRKEVVQFTTPFITVHATLLLRKAPIGSEHKIKSVSDLINQSEVKYGTLEKGIIVRAFKKTNDTLLRIMYRNMERNNPSVFTATNEEGIARVRSEKYAFILPDTIGEYIAHQTPCDLVTMDTFLMNNGYGLALPKGSDIFKSINRGVRILRKRYTLDKLYRKWWFEKSSCNGIKSSKIYSTNNSQSLHLNSRYLSPMIIYICSYLVFTIHKMFLYNVSIFP